MLCQCQGCTNIATRSLRQEQDDGTFRPFWCCESCAVCIKSHVVAEIEAELRKMAGLDGGA